MTALVDVMRADAKKLVDADGVVITYIAMSSEGEENTTTPKAFINPGGLKSPRTNELTWEMIVQIAKADVPEVNRNGDRITIPAAWNETGADKTMRVGAILNHDAAWWMLGLKK